jgi:hypothetical protein
VSDFAEDYRKYLGNPLRIFHGIEKHLIEKLVEEKPEAFEAVKKIALDVVVDEDGRTKVITRIENDK